MLWNEGMRFYTSAEFCSLARQDFLVMASWPFFVSGLLSRHPSVAWNRLSSPDRNFSPWRTLIFKNMVPGIHSGPPARLWFTMVTSHFLVRCGELDCELEACILDLKYAMATDLAMTSWPLHFFWIFLPWFLSCPFFSCTIGSSKTQGV